MQRLAKPLVDWKLKLNYTKTESANEGARKAHCTYGCREEYEQNPTTWLFSRFEMNHQDREDCDKRRFKKWKKVETSESIVREGIEKERKGTISQKKYIVFQFYVFLSIKFQPLFILEVKEKKMIVS